MRPVKGCVREVIGRSTEKLIIKIKKLYSAKMTDAVYYP